MNIYLISQSFNVGYDTYDSAVVIANTDKLLEHPIPDGLQWKQQDCWIGAHDKKGWWHGWVRLEKGPRNLEAVIQMPNKKAQVIGKFDSPDAACKYISAYLILGDTND